jgi:hypothetical protein
MNTVWRWVAQELFGRFIAVYATFVLRIGNRG